MRPNEKISEIFIFLQCIYASMIISHSLSNLENSLPQSFIFYFLKLNFKFFMKTLTFFLEFKMNSYSILVLILIFLIPFSVNFKVFSKLPKSSFTTAFRISLTSSFIFHLFLELFQNDIAPWRQFLGRAALGTRQSAAVPEDVGFRRPSERILFVFLQ